MSVLACSRRGCSNIMCDRYSSQFGYICPGCYDELIEFLTRCGSVNRVAIETFMDSEKPEHRYTTVEAISDVLNEEFPTENVRHAR